MSVGGCVHVWVNVCVNVYGCAFLDDWVNVCVSACVCECADM